MLLVVIPALTVLVGAVVVMCFLAQNLRNLEEKAVERAGDLDTARAAMTERASEFALSLRRRAGLVAHPPPAESCTAPEAQAEDDIDRLLKTAREATDLPSKSTADALVMERVTELENIAPAKAVRPRVAESAKINAVGDTPSSETEKALTAYEEAVENLRRTSRLFNNAVTLYNNAGNTFPLVTISKRLGFAQRERYTAFKKSARDELAEGYSREGEKIQTPKIMNAYMLWTVGMGDGTLEDAEQV